VHAEDASFNVLDIDPATIGIVRTLEVTGSRQPRLTLEFEEAPANPLHRSSAHGRLTTHTGRPISGHAMFVQFFEPDVPFPGPMSRVTTDADGRYHFRMPAIYVYACVNLVAPVPVGQYYDPLAVAVITSECGFPEPATIPPPPTDAARPGPKGSDSGLLFGLSALAAILTLMACRRRLSQANHARETY
jgi:hypothetical protein